ncbi:hypothetical protein XNC1_2079 [Xenorhabdus nematophila ATCC 19061]|uniref:Uncharacterized protein n=1 Tax=Xenorhabdus nematophila (strain ATCC 19061 / DSM 3370 / CCUG 14189 / LMG 1036 / NCIMB 9965 / AN6) TaxID=406817 RepID=D3VEM7_XENNA|nr:hypothetical protein XNC1_2079 [Xenorhabdus nematophila ATCC 19061]
MLNQYQFPVLLWINPPLVISLGDLSDFKVNYYPTFIPAVVIKTRNSVETAYKESTLHSQIVTIQAKRFHSGERCTVVSVITLFMINFSPENIITPKGISQNNRNDE